MLSVKAGIDNNPNPTQADRIAGAKMKDKKQKANLGKFINEKKAERNFKKELKKGKLDRDWETIRQVLNNHNNAKAPKLAKSDLTIYEGSTYAIRKLSKPYSISEDLQSTIHAGS